MGCAEHGRGLEGESRMAAGGGIFRDEKGDFLRAFTFKCGSCDALTVEIWAIARGLRVARQAGFTKIVLQTDSFQACELIQNNKLQTHRNFYLIRQCQELINEFPRVMQVSHVS